MRTPSPNVRSPTIADATSAFGTAATLHHAEGRARILLVCEHASARLPEQFGTLGLAPEHLLEHIAWDPGALDLALGLSARLDAPLVHAGMSRLIYDCNRPPDSPTAVRAVSERFAVPGNRALSPESYALRVAHCYEPFRGLLEHTIASKVTDASDDRPLAIVTIHSFTPVFDGVPREVELGVLHGDDASLADRMLAEAGRITGLLAERNAPYGPGDGVLHTVEQQAEARGLPGVMLEVRNDLLREPDGVADVADRLARLIATCVEAEQDARRGHAG
jgi:predicted N-formylglutamate amidohydrolase